MNIVECNKSTKPGEIITFGTYPHMANGGDKTPIKWRVLQNSGSELFILSEYLLDCKRYHGKSASLTWFDAKDITWHDCDLRHWLNHDFYNKAFIDDEKERINVTSCIDNGEGTAETSDKVFLLGVNEVKKLIDIHGKEFLKALGTEFAKQKQGDNCKLVVYNKTNEKNYININGEMVGCAWWWLRTQGNKPSRACFIGPGTSIRSYGNVTISGYGIRPAIKIKV